MATDVEPLQAIGYESCIVGKVERFGLAVPVYIYSVRKILDKLISEGLTPEEAQEHYEYNMLGAWVGDGTPAFLLDLDETPSEEEMRANIKKMLSGGGNA
mgnify:CR=1 FL=1